jgi:hypothetical protein
MSAEALADYKAKLERLFELDARGEGESTEYSNVCDSMDAPGQQLTDDEIQEANAYSAGLWQRLHERAKAIQQAASALPPQPTEEHP